MTVEEIEKKLIDGISAITNKPSQQITPDKAFHDLGIDSLGFVEILVYIEKTFKLQLIASDLTKKDFENIRTLAAHINRKL
jgi:acyl carrier protein